MTYKIYVDDAFMWSSRDLDGRIVNPMLSLGVNSVGSLTFDILPDNDFYGAFTRMVTTVSVTRDDQMIFVGRVYKDTVNNYKIKTIEVEGVLGYLNDSIVRPYDFTGSVENYFKSLITQHNSQVADRQRLKIGRCTVTDPNDTIVRASSEAPTTWQEINNKLIDLLGGYIVVRYEVDGTYIDYLASYPEERINQEIRFGDNLLDLIRESTGEDLATCIIPYGATIEESENDERVDIKSVNDGKDYIQDDRAVALYGKIYEVVTWDDVTLPSNLKAKAISYLTDRVKIPELITVKAVDLNLIDEELTSFSIGDNVKIISDPHGVEVVAMVKQYDIDLADPVNSTLTIGYENKYYLQQAEKSVATRIDIVRKTVSDKIDRKASTILNESQTYTNSQIETSEETTREMIKEYVKTTDLDEYKLTVATEFEQTAEGFDFKFTTLESSISDDLDATNDRISEISKYIRLIDGSIYLGEEGNPLTTKIANGRISFMYNDVEEVAYISDRKLYITESEILDNIVIGNFAFIPRDNGNLSFKKLGG